MELFHKSISMVGDVVSKVKTDDMTKPTPCEEWDVRALLNHIINEVAWVEPLLQGKTIEEVGTTLDGDLAAEDPGAAWHTYAEPAESAVNTIPGDTTVHLSYADKPARDYENEVGGDVIMHGWDLAQAIGVPYAIDETTAQAILDGIKEMIPMARQYGMVKEAIPVAEGATTEEKLLSEFGRSKNWNNENNTKS